MRLSSHCPPSCKAHLGHLSSCKCPWLPGGSWQSLEVLRGVRHGCPPSRPAASQWSPARSCAAALDPGRQAQNEDHQKRLALQFTPGGGWPQLRQGWAGSHRPAVDSGLRAVFPVVRGPMVQSPCPGEQASGLAPARQPCPVRATREGCREPAIVPQFTDHVRAGPPVQDHVATPSREHPGLMGRCCQSAARTAATPARPGLSEFHPAHGVCVLCRGHTREPGKLLHLPAAGSLSPEGSPGDPTSHSPMSMEKRLLGRGPGLMSPQWPASVPPLQSGPASLRKAVGQERPESGRSAAKGPWRESRAVPCPQLRGSRAAGHLLARRGVDSFDRHCEAVVHHCAPCVLCHRAQAGQSTVPPRLQQHTPSLSMEMECHLHLWVFVPQPNNLFAERMGSVRPRFDPAARSQ